jgi:limonene 1,2-monooxygenase
LRTTPFRLGVFLAPFHPVDESPTLCFQRDIDLAVWADKLGFGEFWYGEHHTGGYEISASPELMIAAAAQHAKRILFGTGVVSLPYHNPLMVANRIAQLDHLTMGRVIFGAGPGLLVSDAHMLGLDVAESRDKLDQALGVIRRLLRGEWVTEQTGWYRLRDAHCQVTPYNPAMEVCVASTFSPNGGVLAAKHEAGMLCLASTVMSGFDALSTNWKIAQDAAAKAGRIMSPGSIRCATDIYVAETREKALADVREGHARYNEYILNQSKHLPASPGHVPLEAQIASGEIVVGTPEDAIAQIRRLEAKVPDFGCLLLLEKNWASVENTRRSYELLARYVLPAINGSNLNRQKSFDWAGAHREGFVEVFAAATQRAFAKHREAETAEVRAERATG